MAIIPLLQQRTAGRVVEGARLERGCRAIYLGFESLAVHHFNGKPLKQPLLRNKQRDKSKIDTLYDKNQYGLRLLSQLMRKIHLQEIKCETVKAKILAKAPELHYLIKELNEEDKKLYRLFNRYRFE